MIFNTPQLFRRGGGVSQVPMTPPPPSRLADKGYLKCFNQKKILSPVLTINIGITGFFMCKQSYNMMIN